MKFNQDNYRVENLKIENKTIKYRNFENIIYVKNPVDSQCQIMNIYAPEDYFEGKSIEGLTLKTAPIFFPNNIGGYMPATPAIPGETWIGKGINSVFVALSKGYIVASAGARGRSLQSSDGKFIGKAPACIVDLKAAVRYLRHNKDLVPGDVEKIISNGTSAGGALSTLLGATGNNEDYEPYLKEIGAADERDDIFAVSAYCPIINLENADMAYEWYFKNIHNFKRLKINKSVDFKIERTWIEGQMNEEQIELSNKLASLFPEYVNSLNIKDVNGNLLSLDENGVGTFREYIKNLIVESAQEAINKDENLENISFIKIVDGVVIDIDIEEYIKYQTRMKITPAFDGVELNTAENDLFGDKEIKDKHFSKFSFENSKLKGEIAEKQIVKMLNPMSYIDLENATISKHWRVRHGAIDSDTALAIPAILSTKLKNKGISVDFQVPWGVPHSGDYDLEELFEWIKKITK